MFDRTIFLYYIAPLLAAIIFGLAKYSYVYHKWMSIEINSVVSCKIKLGSPERTTYTVIGKDPLSKLLLVTDGKTKTGWIDPVLAGCSVQR